MVAATRMVRTGQLAPDVYQAQAVQFLGQMGIGSSAAPVATSSASGAAPSGIMPSVPDAAADSASVIADRLASLAKLHADGVLTEDEFTAAKRKVLEE